MSEMGPRHGQESIMMITGTGDATRLGPASPLDPSCQPEWADVSTIGSSDQVSAWALVGPTTADRAGEASTSTKGGLVTLVRVRITAGQAPAGCMH